MAYVAVGSPNKKVNKSRQIIVPVCHIYYNTTLFVELFQMDVINEV